LIVSLIVDAKERSGRVGDRSLTLFEIFNIFLKECYLEQR
jgi:hypothetical protein